MPRTSAASPLPDMT
uniref:Uncharacterized protein n=1 Tax=Arundo donax TaxID=35708 RepID=A0A0A8YJL1_ARUDO